MFIEIKDLEVNPIDFREEYSPGAIDLGPELRQLSLLHAEGQADLVEEHHGKHEIIQDIRLRGKLNTSLEADCARCVEPVVHKLSREFDLLYRPLGSDAGRDELSVTDAEAEIGYYEGEGLLLEDAIREQVLLALPLKMVCRDECKGLCPQCGQNLNESTCSCITPHQDLRWSALKEIRDKLNQ
jgi:uncharacterized protein